MKRMKFRSGHFFQKTAVLLSAGIAVLFGFGLFAGTKLPAHFCTSESGPFRLNGTLWTVSPNAAAETSGELKLLSVPLKKVEVTPVVRSTVTLCGTPFGLKMYTEGALVVALVDVDGTSGRSCPAEKAGLRVGDVIRTINDQAIKSNSDAAACIQNSGGKKLTMTVERNGKNETVTLIPQYSESCGTYKAGLWIKDSCAGIGTLTYVTDDGIFAGLGHGISDMDTETLMPVQYGEIVPVKLVGITKGIRGVPGELRGFFASDEEQGILQANVAEGVYGQIRGSFTGQRVEVALKQEIRRGPAQIWTTVTGDTPRAYDVKIERICYDDSEKTQNMIIQITDTELLEQTGGIVQGMSGSPLIQNGRLIGAVTHVFVNDPTRGYGIFAENMLAESAYIAAQIQLAA